MGSDHTGIPNKGRRGRLKAIRSDQRGSSYSERAAARLPPTDELGAVSSLIAHRSVTPYTRPSLDLYASTRAATFQGRPFRAVTNRPLSRQTRGTAATFRAFAISRTDRRMERIFGSTLSRDRERRRGSNRLAGGIFENHATIQ